jgi:hypothetical protein
MKCEYDNDVLFKAHDPNGNAVTKPCTIVGITRIESEDQSRALKAPVGSVLYTVEFGDGSMRLFLRIN